jgi:hypothetical protein
VQVLHRGRVLYQNHQPSGTKHRGCVLRVLGHGPNGPMWQVTGAGRMACWSGSSSCSWWLPAVSCQHPAPSTPSWQWHHQAPGRLGGLGVGPPGPLPPAAGGRGSVLISHSTISYPKSSKQLIFGLLCLLPSAPQASPKRAFVCTNLFGLTYLLVYVHDVSTGQKRFPEHNGLLRRRGLLC